MTVTTPPQLTRIGPAHRSRVWLGDRTLASNAGVDEITGFLRDNPNAKAWWCLPMDPAAIASTAAFLHLDALAVEDVLSLRETPKLDDIKGTVILISARISFDPLTSELAVARVSILASDRALVVIADDDTLGRITSVLDQCAGRMHDDGIAAGLHVVVQTLVDSYAGAVELMEETTDALTSSLFDDRPMGRDEQLQAFRMRQAISHLRKVAGPMTEVTAELSGAAARVTNTQDEDPVGALLPLTTARRFADVADHARHSADATVGLREMLTSAFETNLALSDVHLNMIMKKLSAWAAIIAVPTLITGFLGMNVPYPGFGQGPGFVIGLIVMVTAVITLFILFRRSDWL